MDRRAAIGLLTACFVGLVLAPSAPGQDGLGGKIDKLPRTVPVSPTPENPPAAVREIPRPLGPKTIHTGALRMTGHATEARSIQTSQLRMTGHAMGSLTINTSRLRMTGQAP